MTFSERIEKIETLNNYLLGVSLALSKLNECQWPSWEIRTAISHIKQAEKELNKDIHKLKQMSDEHTDYQSLHSDAGAEGGDKENI